VTTGKFTRDLDWNLLNVFDQIAQAGGISKAQTRSEHVEKASQMN